MSLKKVMPVGATNMRLFTFLIMTLIFGCASYENVASPTSRVGHQESAISSNEKKMHAVIDKEHLSKEESLAEGNNDKHIKFWGK